MPVLRQTTLLLVASNVFMTFAWRARLRNLDDRPWWIAAFVPFAVLYVPEPLKLDDLWAALCMVGAAHFTFRSN